MTCLLFYGPGAEAEALRYAGSVGRQLSPPVGANGLKVSDARRVSNLLASAPVGSRIGVVIVGPMDLANYKASDVLLKSVEEFDPKLVCPVLWAEDLGGVRPTIRSRCLARWSGGQEEEDDIETEVYDLVQATVSGELHRIWSLLDEFKGQEQGLLGQIARVVSADPTPAHLRVWEAIRPVARWRNPTRWEVAAALYQTAVPAG